MTTGNAGNGSIPPNGENPEDFSQYSLYQLVGLLREHLSKFNSQAISLPEGSNGFELGTLRQSLSELALNLSSQKKSMGGSNAGFIIDKIRYVNEQLDAQEKLLNKWDTVRSKQTTKILDTLFEIRNRVPKGDELIPSGLDESQYEYLNIIRRRSKYLKYDPDQHDDYLTFLYKLLADELARNKRINAELIPAKEKVVEREVDSFMIRAEFNSSDKKRSTLPSKEPPGLIPPVNGGEITFKKAIQATNKARKLHGEGKWIGAIQNYRIANDCLNSILHMDEQYRTLYHRNLDAISDCERADRETKKKKGPWWKRR